MWGSDAEESMSNTNNSMSEQFLKTLTKHTQASLAKMCYCMKYLFSKYGPILPSNKEWQSIFLLSILHKQKVQREISAIKTFLSVFGVHLSLTSY